MSLAPSHAGRSTPGGISRPTAARTLAYFYLAGAALVAVMVALPERQGGLAGQLAVGAAAGLTGAFLLVYPERIPRGGIHALLALGTVMVTALTAFEGTTGGVYVFYVWVALEAFYLLRRLDAAAEVAFAATAYGGVLLISPGPRPLHEWVIAMGVGVVAGVLLSVQRGRIDLLVASLDDAARTDPLTGLLNRRAFEELFEGEIERVTHSGGRLSVLLGDLDGFKGMNDRFGHEAGDAALVRVADDMIKWKRKVDTPARVGGEEFALVLPDTDERGAFLVAERLRRAAHRSFAEHPMPLTISFGVATFPEHGEDIRGLMRSADRALYAAKDLGKDRTAIYSAEVARVLARASARRGAASSSWRR